MVPCNRSEGGIRERAKATFFIKGKKYTSTISSRRISVGNLSFSGNTLIGKPYGKHEITGLEIIVLPALPKDQMENIKRGPQVILPWDAATILFYAGISSGKMVIEAGSGSGSLTIALASAVAPDGHVISFDIKSSNVEIAKRNVKKAGFSVQVIFHTGDIRDLKQIEERLLPADFQGADTVVLDIPDPWEAVESVKSLLKIGGVFVAYLPTMNQVERLRKEIEGWDIPSRDLSCDFVDAYTMETLRREIVVKPGAVRPDYSMLGHTGYLTFARRI